MKVLLIYDDIWHPAEVIDRGLKSFPERLSGYEFDRVITAKDILTPEFINEFPVIINAKGNSINAANTAPWFEPGVTECMPKHFRAYVENGGGLLALHSGNTFRRETAPGAEMAALIGNAFVSHPPRCLTRIVPEGDSPIVKGVGEFEVRDEHYILDIDADDKEVFLRSYSEKGGEQISGYTRKIGKGRVLVLTPGHTTAVFEDPNFQTLLMNCIDWCAGLI